MTHIAAVTRLRLDTEGRAYYRGKRAAGKKPQEALRCLKKRISDVIYKKLVADAFRAGGAGPRGHCGASQESSAVDLPPHIDTADQPLPDPHSRSYTAPPATRKRQSHGLSRTPVDNRGEPESRAAHAAASQRKRTGHRITALMLLPLREGVDPCVHPDRYPLPRRSIVPRRRPPVGPPMTTHPTAVHAQRHCLTVSRICIVPGQTG